VSTNKINIEAVNARAKEAQTPMTKIPSVEERVEEFASLEHDRWARWQKWCHRVYRDGNFEDSILRWERQIATKYADLSEEEKQSDRDQVYPYIEALTADRLALLTELTQTIQAIDFYGWNEQTQSKIKEKVQAHLDELINSNRIELDNPQI